MKTDSISIESFKMIVKAGVLIGQVNPKKNPDVLTEIVLKEFLKVGKV